jgi:hypothetical protein
MSASAVVNSGAVDGSNRADSDVLKTVVLDVAAVDMKITLFEAAVASYKRASVCNPFPPDYANGEVRDFTSLERILCNLNLDRRTIKLLRAPQPDLLSWLVNSVQVNFASTPLPEFEKRTKFLHKFPAKSLARAPEHVFEVLYSAEHPLSRGSFEEKKKKYGTFLGYHGSAMHNWHSIIHNGFDVGFCREDQVIFGRGTYFSTDPSVAMSFIQPARVRAQSLLGPSLGCLVVCEIVNHPSVKRSGADASDSPAPSRSSDIMELDPKLPKSYVLVTENDLVRVKYLLVFKQAAPPKSRKIFVLILFYVLLLAFIAMMRSKKARKLAYTFFM